MLTNEDIEQIKGVFDDRYRKVDACDSKHDSVDANMNSIDKKVTTVSTKLSMLLGILGCIGAAVVAIAAKVLFGG